MLTARKLMEAAVKRGTQLVAEETPSYIRSFVERVDIDSPDYSIARMGAAVREAALGSMREATPSGAMGQLLRAQTQRIMDAWYTENQDNLSYLAVCATVSSKQRGEFYNPLHSAVVQSETVGGEPYGESAVRGEDLFVRNKKFMGGESFEMELVDDDQTGQIRQRQQDLAEAAQRTLEIYFAQRMLGTAGTFGPLTIPASNWINFSSSVNEFNNTLAGLWTPRVGTAGLGNRLATMRPLSAPALKEANTLLRQMRDLNGNRLGYKADTLLISPSDEIHAAIIANSSFYPTVQGQQGQTFNTADSGRAGAQGAVNPWKGAFEVVINRYLPDWSCWLGMKGRGVVFQLRDAIQITQEAPNAGKSHDTDTLRLRSRARWEFEVTGPRTWIQLSDGTGAGVGSY
jgi:hypothetical protein